MGRDIMDKCVESVYLEDGIFKKVDLFDGNIQGDLCVVYEVIRVVDGTALFLDKHLKRFENSASVSGLKLWLTKEEIEKYLQTLISKNDLKDGNVKLVFNFQKSDSEYTAKNYKFFVIPHSYPSESDYLSGVTTILYHGERKNPNAKVQDLSFREKVEIEIKKSKAFEAILIDRGGFVTEGSKSNIFMVKGDRVITAQVDTVLPGTTRSTIMEICKDLKIEVSEEEVHENYIEDLDGLFICGTSPKVLPISKVDNYLFASSTNDLIIKIMKGYDNKVREYLRLCNVK
jgi:branched-chain amino acid aminotransferase